MADTIATVRTLIARHDPRLRALVVDEWPLARAPRPGAAARVRAGSGIAWFGHRLAVIQDDGRSLALVDPETRRIALVPLVPGARARGADSKRSKLDLEACAAVTVRGEAVLLVFGSGSRPRRRMIAVVRDPQRPRAVLHDAAAFYGQVAANGGFSGDAPNVEGATARRDRLVLANRGNRSRGSANAIGEIAVGALLACLETGGAAPALRNVRRASLGSIGRLPLGFTALAHAHGRMLFTATAEDTRDAVRDGAVAGSVVGVLGRARGRWAPLTHADGRPFVAKVEGLCAQGRGYRRLWAVTDADDPREPARLCAVRLLGPW